MYLDHEIMLLVLTRLFDLTLKTGFPRRLPAQRLHKWNELLFSSIFAVKTCGNIHHSQPFKLVIKNFICQLEKCAIGY